MTISTSYSSSSYPLFLNRNSKSLCEKTKSLLIHHIQTHNLVSISMLLEMLDPQDIQKDNSILLEAVISGNEHIVESLLKKGFRPDLYNSQITSCLITQAACRGFTNIAKMLIEAHSNNLASSQNFDPPLMDMQVFVDGNYTVTISPLAVAVDQSDVLLAQMLLQHGATIDQSDTTGFTPLERVCRNKYNKDLLTLFTTQPTYIKNIDHLISAILANQLETVKFFIETVALKIEHINNDTIHPLLYAKIYNHKEIFDYLANKFPNSYALNKTLTERKLLAHVSDINGTTKIVHKTNSSNTLEEKLGAFRPEYIYKFISKRTKEFGKYTHLFNQNLINQLSETASFTSNTNLIKNFFYRWKKNQPVYIPIITHDHHIGMLLYKDKIVWSNLWATTPDGTSTYHSFSFKQSCFTIQTLIKILEHTDSLSKLKFLKEELPQLLQYEHTPLTKSLNNHHVSAQKDNIGNCTWINSLSLQLPHSILHEMENIQSLHPSESEIKKIFDKQTTFCNNLRSYYQIYLINKALRRIKNETSSYEPDFMLISQTFKSCYPYSSENLEPFLIKMWKDEEENFYKYMPKYYIKEFKQKKKEITLLIQETQETKNQVQKQLKSCYQTLSEINKQRSRLPSISNSLGLSRSPPSKRVKTTYS